MVRAPILLLAALLAPSAVAAQALSVLHIKISLDAAGATTPVPQHRLLISDNPPTATPRAAVTGPDGTVDIKLAPGQYIIESDRSVAFQGKAYRWTVTTEVVGGRVNTLELGIGNADADAGAPAATAADGGTAPDADPVFLLPRWQNSVVAIWSPLSRGSGFVINAGGTIVTNQRLVGNATAVEVQLDAGVKVIGSVVTSDVARNVAVLRINPSVLTAIQPLPVECGSGEPPAIAEGSEIYALGGSFRQQTEMATGTVSRVDSHRVSSDMSMQRDSAGGPVFAGDGRLIGLTTLAENDNRRNERAQVVRMTDVCGAVAAAEAKLTDVAVPGSAHLPVEPTRPTSMDALKAEASRRAGSLNPYQMTSSAFDINIITPLLIYGAAYQDDQIARRQTGARRADAVRSPMVRPLLDFRNWSNYLQDYPPVLVIRVTPKLQEGFWTTVARGAAYTQGVAVPPIKKPGASFDRMTAFCGETEVTPIHPFKLEQRLNDDQAIYEGLYIYDPAAFGPHCATVSFVLYSEKTPGKGETRTLDAAIVQQIWQDFASYRSAGTTGTSPHD